MNGEHKVGGASSIARLLTEKDFRTMLGGMSERKFKELRAAGIVGAPLELGPRVPRWTQADYEETLQRLPRRAATGEPQALAAGRQARADRMKVAAATGGGK